MLNLCIKPHKFSWRKYFFNEKLKWCWDNYKFTFYVWLDNFSDICESFADIKMIEKFNAT